MKNKKLIGIILAVLFLLLLYYTSPLINNNFDGALGYMMKSVQRILFFAVELIIFVKLFKKDSMRSIVNMNCFKDAVPACSAMFIYVVFDVITYVVIGAKSWLNTTMPIVVSCLIFMQLATGLWEKLTIILDNYVQWVMLAIILIVATVFLYKKPVRK